VEKTGRLKVEDKRNLSRVFIYSSLILNFKSLLTDGHGPKVEAEDCLSIISEFRPYRKENNPSPLKH
jgi:hypothetical protein